MNRGRLQALEARRRTLLGRCEEQRLDLSYRISQLRPQQLTAWGRRRIGGSAANPLTWVVGAISLLMMLRRKKGGGVAPRLGWIAGLMALATRTTRLLRLLAQLRAVYLGFQATRRARTAHPVHPRE